MLRGFVGGPPITFDGAGVIEGIGAGVSDSRIGERVWIYEAQWKRDFGTAAELLCLPSELTVALPNETSFLEGACLGIPALTAYACMFSDGDVKGQTILVTGGAGAVGRYALQFAGISGATVITTVSSQQKGEIARAAGAHHIINYKEEDVVSRIKELTDNVGVDRIVEVEFGGNIEISLQILKSRGVISSYASMLEPEPQIPFYQFAYKNITLHNVVVFEMAEILKKSGLCDINRWMESGELTHNIFTTYNLEDVVAAHEAVEAGPLGKVILEIDN